MAGEPIEVTVRVERELDWWRPPVNALCSAPHGLATGVLAVASVVVAVVIGLAVALTGRAPAVLVRFQVMTLRERVRCYSYFFALRSSHPPFSFALQLEDPGDDPMTSVAVRPRTVARAALVVHWVRVVPHLLVLLPIAVVMDACYPVWILLCAANRGWPESFARFLVAIERWVAHLALYALLVIDEPPAFGLAANGYVPVGRQATA